MALAFGKTYEMIDEIMGPKFYPKNNQMKVVESGTLFELTLGIG